MDTAAREAKRKASRDANQARRAKLECSSVLLKIQSKRLKLKQKEALQRLFLETKWFYNHALATGSTDYKLTSVKVKTPQGFESRELISGARIRQSALKDLETSKKAVAALAGVEKANPIAMSALVASRLTNLKSRVCVSPHFHEPSPARSEG